MAVPPEAFDDFVSRRQGVHPTTRLARGSAAVGLAIEQLRGFAATGRSLGIGALCRLRVRDLSTQPGSTRSLDSGDWTWRAEAEARGEPRVAFIPRGFRRPSGPRFAKALPEPTAMETLVLDQLNRRGASFVVDIARETALGTCWRPVRLLLTP